MSQPYDKWAGGPVFVRSRRVLRQTGSPVERDIKEVANILRFCISATFFPSGSLDDYLSLFSSASFNAPKPANGFASSSVIGFAPGSVNTV